LNLPVAKGHGNLHSTHVTLPTPCARDRRKVLFCQNFIFIFLSGSRNDTNHEPRPELCIPVVPPISSSNPNEASNQCGHVEPASCMSTCFSTIPLHATSAQPLKIARGARGALKTRRNSLHGSSSSLHCSLVPLMRRGGRREGLCCGPEHAAGGRGMSREGAR
jgi:hypothetical protein